MKKFLISISLLMFAGVAFAKNPPVPPFPLQQSIYFYNTTHDGFLALGHPVLFHITDDAGHSAYFLKHHTSFVAFPVWHRFKPMWHHNITVTATELKFGGKTIPCQPFDGHFSYLQEYRFAAMNDDNGQFVCKALNF